MPLKKFWFTNLGPFDEIAFELDDQVNVFTGPNNSGKTTSLTALGEIVVFPFGIPKKLFRSEAADFKVELDPKGTVFAGRLPVGGEQQSRVAISVMGEVGFSYFEPAIRRSTDFRARVPSPLNDESDKAGRDKELRRRRKLIETDASLISDETIVQKIIDLDYRAYRMGNPNIWGIVDRTAAILSEITEGYPIQFAGVDEDGEGLFPKFNTLDGDLPLNVLSQGTQSLIQWLGRLVIGMAEYYDDPEHLEKRRGILIIDEIDAHLHPSWQRRIIPALTKHFPNLQIFCSTHSPLMLAGLKAGQVQLLDRGEDGKVTVSRNEQDIVAWSADEILQSFLHVRNPTDLETACNIERLQQLRRIHRPTDEQARELERLRETVRADLIGGPLSRDLEELRTILNEAKSRYDPAPSSD